ncbi:MAG: RNA polymerase sigma factor [Paenibacillus sp.]|nr:RNA polymerase sigma factor [Paenibacillus sp.]
MEDESLIREICNGDDHSFQQFVERYSQHVYKVANSVLRDAKEAEDAAQESFLQIYKSLPEYRHQGLKTWITRIALHKAIDANRRRERLKEQSVDYDKVLSVTPSLDEDVLKGVIRRERKDRLWNEIQSLPSVHRDVVVAFYLDHKNYEQIAAEHGITPKTVESRLYRARHWIRTHWKEEEWL